MKYGYKKIIVRLAPDISSVFVHLHVFLCCVCLLLVSKILTLEWLMKDTNLI